jgi:hypothetical protein
MHIWQIENKGDDKIIAYFNDTIYKCNPKESDIQNVVDNLKNNQIPTNNCIGIPVSYLKEIHLQEGKNYIEIFFGADSTEQLKINDSVIRNEIFQFFRTNIPSTTFKMEKYSKLQSGKKPLIAMVVILVIGLWTHDISTGMENGEEYSLIGSVRSLAGIVIALASIGTKKVLLLFGSLFAIALTSFIIRIKAQKIVLKIKVKR